VTAPVIDLYRASHEARIGQLRRDVAAREEQLHQDLDLVRREFAAVVREILARYNPTCPLVALHACDEPTMAAEVLFAWGRYGDLWEEVRAAGAREVAVLAARVARAEAALTGRRSEPVPVPVASPRPRLQLLRAVPDPTGCDLTASLTLPSPL